MTDSQKIQHLTEALQRSEQSNRDLRVEREIFQRKLGEAERIIGDVKFLMERAKLRDDQLELKLAEFKRGESKYA